MATNARNDSDNQYADHCVPYHTPALDRLLAAFQDNTRDPVVIQNYAPCLPGYTVSAVIEGIGAFQAIIIVIPVIGTDSLQRNSPVEQLQFLLPA